MDQFYWRVHSAMPMAFTLQRYGFLAICWIASYIWSAFQVLLSFERGSEAFLSFNGVLFISSFKFLTGHLVVQIGSRYQQLLNLCLAGGNPSLTYESLICDFLQKQGKPCPACFAAVADTFSTIIDLSLIGCSYFTRCRKQYMQQSYSKNIKIGLIPFILRILQRKKN